MPELPEVETVRRGLLPTMEGRLIQRADVHRPDLRWPLPEDLAARLTGRRVIALRRRSKYILADLDDGWTVILHLGMSGRMIVSGAMLGEYVQTVTPVGKHDHIVLTMEGGASVTFNDARRFGMLDLARTEEVESHRLLAGLGPEPLGNLFDESVLAKGLRGRAPIKSALLDQKIVSGLGNIYVCEALHRAQISPERPAGSITDAEIARLVPAIRMVLEEAIAAGGSSLRDYRQADGELGYFQHSFRAYGREGQPCPTPDCDGTIRRIVQSGRSTFHCPTCQR